MREKQELQSGFKSAIKSRSPLTLSGHRATYGELWEYNRRRVWGGGGERGEEEKKRKEGREEKKEKGE